MLKANLYELQNVDFVQNFLVKGNHALLAKPDKMPATYSRLKRK